MGDRRVFCCATWLAVMALSCSPPRPASDAAPPGPTTAPRPAATVSGPPLDFVLDSVQRDADWAPASEQLRGKRAVILVLTSWDGGSLVLLRTLAPMLRALPPDATCLLVAKQPLADRVLAATLFDAEDTPCLRAMADPTRGRVGDLAKVTIVPATLVLRADGRLVGASPGVVTADTVRAALDAAR
ncbi:MAG: hypothetical protein NVSMB47_00660 [Polyangiales bacterium]